MPESLSSLIASNLIQWLLTVLVIIVLTLIALRLVSIASKEIDKRIIIPTKDPNRRARLLTVRKAARSTLQVVILSLAVLIALGTLGIDIGPALAAAGILGLAISLGAQTLIRDVIGGLTILFEDEYRVGDQVKIGSLSGEVEQITLRRTDVRDAEGRLYMVPNGDVRVVANESREWARALVELNFGYESDVNKAIAALDGALVRLATNSQVKPHLLAAPEIFGWNSLSDWSVVVRLSAKVTAGKQVEVARVMRQYALEALQETGVAVETINRIATQPGNA